MEGRRNCGGEEKDWREKGTEEKQVGNKRRKYGKVKEALKWEEGGIRGL